jgi:hypothetical protein
MSGQIDIVAPVTEIYVPTKSWYVFADDSNKIIKTIGSMFPVSNLQCTDDSDLHVIELGHINKSAWDLLNKIVHIPYYGGYIDSDQEEIIYYRLKASVSDSIKENGKYYTSSDVLTITAKCLDENDDDILQVQNLQLKKLRLTDPPKLHRELILIDPTRPDEHNIKILSMTSNTQQIKIQSPGEYTLRLTYIHTDTDNRSFNLERYITINRSKC